MKKHRKHPLPSTAEAEKQRFRRLLRQKPVPYPDRQKAERTDGKGQSDSLEKPVSIPVTIHKRIKQ